MPTSDETRTPRDGRVQYAVIARKAMTSIADGATTENAQRLHWFGAGCIGGSRSGSLIAYALDALSSKPESSSMTCFS
jgi:hypothetical protein